MPHNLTHFNIIAQCVSCFVPFHVLHMNCRKFFLYEKFNNQTFHQFWYQNPTVHHRWHKTCHRTRFGLSSNLLQSSQTVSLKSVLILSSHLLLGFVSGVFQGDFSTKFLYTFLLFSIRNPWPAQRNLFRYITVRGLYKSRNSSLLKSYTVRLVRSKFFSDHFAIRHL